MLKKRLLFSILCLLLSGVSFGQSSSMSVNQKQLLLKQAIKMLKKTKAAMQVNFNAQVDEDEKKSWDEIVGNLTHQQVVIENDLNPVGILTNSSKMLPIKEYFFGVQTRYQPRGLSFNISFEEAKVLFKNQTDVFIYARKYMQGTWHLNGYEDKEVIRNYDYCRIVLRVEAANQESLKIAYIDNDLSEINAATSVESFSTALSDRTLEDMVEKIVNDLSLKIPKSETKEINIQKVSYQGKGIINSFSHLFTGQLKAMLLCTHRNLKVTLPVRSIYRVLTLNSSYTVEGNELEVNVNLVDSLGHEVVNSSYKILIDTKSEWANGLVPKEAYVATNNVLTNVIKETPDNYDIKKLQFEVRTNKGSAPQSFREGEELSLYVIANRPCRVRIIYKDAVDSLFFMNNSDFQITASQTNIPQPLKERFLCSAPFGVEAIIGFATTGSFEQLNTREKGGLHYLIEPIEKLRDKSAGSQTVQRMVQITSYPK